MKFFENVLELKTDTIYNFISSSLTILVFAPIRIIQEIVKKCIFLQRKQLDMLLFLAVMLGMGIAAIFSFIQIRGGEFSLFTGTIPPVVLYAGCAILVAGYVSFNSMRFVAYDELITSRLPGKKVVSHNANTKKEECITDEPVEAPEINSLSEEEMDSVMSWLKENDYVEAKPNEEIMHSAEIRKYQNDVKDKILALEDVAEQSAVYSQEELALLQKRLDMVTPPSKYLSKEFLSNIQKTKQTDEVNVLEEEITSIPDDFRLCI